MKALMINKDSEFNKQKRTNFKMKKFNKVFLVTKANKPLLGKIYANSDLTTSFVFEANKKKKSMKLADVNFLVVPNRQNGFNVWYKGKLFTTDASNLNLFKSMWDEMINKTMEANNHGI